AITNVARLTPAVIQSAGKRWKRSGPPQFPTSHDAKVTATGGSATASSSAGSAPMSLPVSELIHCPAQMETGAVTAAATTPEPAWSSSCGRLMPAGSVVTVVVTGVGLLEASAAGAQASERTTSQCGSDRAFTPAFVAEARPPGLLPLGLLLERRGVDAVA